MRNPSPRVEPVISTEARRALRGGRNGEISRAMFQIHSFHNIASPSLWGGAHTRECGGGGGEIFINYSSLSS